MNKIRLQLLIIGFVGLLYGECDGFNWYHNIDTNHCDPGDIKALQQFIRNSGDSLEMDMDVDFNGEVDVIELGWQLWENGRLIHWICRLQNNNLIGEIPLSICELNNINAGSYWFDLGNNYLCPPYPECMLDLIGNQHITNCK